MTNKLLPAKIILVLIIMLSFSTAMGVVAYSLTLKKNPSIAIQPTPKPTIALTPSPTPVPSEEYSDIQKLPTELADFVLKDMADDYNPCGEKKPTIKDYSGGVEYEDLNNDNTKEVFITAESFCGESLIGNNTFYPVFIYQKLDGKWTKIGFVNSEYGVTNEITDGYKDISYSNHYAGGTYIIYILSKWNKSEKTYEDFSSNEINNEIAVSENFYDYNENDMDFWSTYTNDKYKFDIKYPFTWSSENTDSGNFAKPQPYKVVFENFTIRVWDNSDYPKPEQFFASESFCALNKSLCEPYAGKSEAPLKTVKIGNNTWIKIGDNTQRFFMPNPNDHYIIELELNKAGSKNKFNQMLSTFEFTKK